MLAATARCALVAFLSGALATLATQLLNWALPDGHFSLTLLQVNLWPALTASLGAWAWFTRFDDVIGPLQSAAVFAGVWAVVTALALPWTWVAFSPVALAFFVVTVVGALVRVPLVVKVHRVLPRSAEDVFACLTRLDLIEAHPKVKRLEVREVGKAGPGSPGSRREVVLDGGVFVEEVLAWTPPVHLSYRIVEADVPVDHLGGRIDLKVLHDKLTEVLWTSTFVVTAPFIAGLVGHWARRSMERDLDEHLLQLRFDLLHDDDRAPDDRR